MLKQPQTQETATVCTTADPGICGFPCTIRARKSDPRTVLVEIGETECEQISKLAQKINQISLRELFAPLTRNPVYAAAQQCGCHASCIIPAAILKTAEIAMEMALPKPVLIEFEICKKTEK